MKKYIAFFMAALVAVAVGAQTVRFPSPSQPGVAYGSHSGNRYSLANDLFKASFLEKNGTLTFDCLLYTSDAADE